MGIVVEDLHDLIRLIDTHQEWKAELRRVLLTEELLSLPDIVRRLTERVDLIAQELERVSKELERVSKQLERVSTDLQRVSDDLGKLTAAVQSLAVDVADLKGSDLEAKYRLRAHAYFDHIMRRLHVLSTEELAGRLEDACDQGIISDRVRHDILLADLVAIGKRLDTAAQSYLLVEVSAKIDSRDVERAARRAVSLAKLGLDVIPVVAGRSITDEATRMADEKGVRPVLDGREISTQPQG